MKYFKLTFKNGPIKTQAENGSLYPHQIYRDYGYLAEITELSQEDFENSELPEVLFNDLVVWE
jgi:hypothetical protein